MPFPFRNPVDTSYDDSSDSQDIDPKLHDIVQKMIDAGEPEENIASVIKQYTSAKTTSQPQVPQTQGTGKTTEKVNPDSEWWKGATRGFTDSMKEDIGGRPLINWGKGALSGALNTVGSMITDPLGTIGNIPSSLYHLPGQITDAAMKSGTPEGKANFQEMMGNIGGTPLLMDAISQSGPAIKASSPAIGAGLQSIGDFIAKNQPITGMAPPAILPRTFRLLEKGTGKGISKIGDILNPDEPTSLGSSGQLDIDLNTPIVNNGSGDSSASLEALSRQASMKAKGQQYYVYDRTGQGRPIIGPDAVDYNAQKGETFGIMNKDGKFQKLTDNGGKVPPEWQTAQKESAAIQKNVDNKYGQGNSGQASPSTQSKLNAAKNKVPLINRPGTVITLKNPTPEMIQQAQRLGYQFDSKTSDGQWKMRQTGRPMTVSSAPTNTSLSNIDLNAPINIGGGGGGF